MKRLIIVFAALALVGNAHAASQDCVADAAATAATAQVQYVGDLWGPVPLWSINLPGRSISMHAYTEEEVRQKATTILQGECAASVPAEATAPVVLDPAYIDRANALAATAEVSYLGDSWGPVPLWTVWIEELNTSFNVHANTEAEARIAVLASIISSLKTNEREAPAPSVPDPAVVDPTTSTDSVSESTTTSSDPAVTSSKSESVDTLGMWFGKFYAM